MNSFSLDNILQFQKAGIFISGYVLAFQTQSFERYIYATHLWGISSQALHCISPKKQVILGEPTFSQVMADVFGIELVLEER